MVSPPWAHVNKKDLPGGPPWGYLGTVPSKRPEIKVRPTEEEKALFEKAAAAARHSVSTWLTVAGLEKADRDGVKLPKRTEGNGKGGRKT
jgi:hypothetical protein